ncbi:hypothetical protein BGZ47_008000 [Haplosporangium gracile]|nr:hypothetical protein BGZ47_008000 [Haplosporangium gracile]
MKRRRTHPSELESKKLRLDGEHNEEPDTSQLATNTLTASSQSIDSTVEETQQKGLTFSSKKRNYDDSSCSAVDDIFKRLCLGDQSSIQPHTKAQVDNGNNQPDGAEHFVPVSGPLGADAAGTSEPPRQPITETQTDNDNQHDSTAEDTVLAREPLGVDAPAAPEPNRQPSPTTLDRAVNNVAVAAPRCKKRNYYEGISSDTYNKKVRWDEQLVSSSASTLPRPPKPRTVCIGVVPDRVTTDKILDLIITGDIESACLDFETHSALVSFSLEPFEPIAPEVFEAIKRGGAARSVVVGDWSSTILSEETIKAEFVAFDQVEYFKTDVEKRAAFIHFVTIDSAVKAKAPLSKDPRYLDLHLRFGKD